MDWRILLFLLILLACPIAMSWTMRHKPKPYDRQRMRGREEASHAVADPEASFARLENRQLAVECELEALKNERKQGNDEKNSEEFGGGIVDGPRRRFVLANTGIILMAGMFGACGGAEHSKEGTDTNNITATDTTIIAPGPVAPRVPAPSTAGSARSQLVALGDSIFHGQVAGGTCSACHGQRGSGGQIGPNLTDAEWLHGDGSNDFIVGIVTNGVSVAIKSPGIMPPKGGAPLTPEQIRAVAAYVHSLGRRG